MGLKTGSDSSDEPTPLYGKMDPEIQKEILR